MSVKTFVTGVLTLVFAFLSIRGDITGQEFLTVFSVVIAFYFGTQYQQNKVSVGKAKTDSATAETAKDGEVETQTAE